MMRRGNPRLIQYSDYAKFTGYEGFDGIAAMISIASLVVAQFAPHHYYRIVRRCGIKSFKPATFIMKG